VLKRYLNNTLKKRWIRPLKSLVKALVLFILKKRGSLRLYIDYKGLNRIIKKNRYLLSFISKTLNQLVSVKRFIKLDLKNAYYRIRIKEGDK
jgi:hypothetical protein